MSLNDQQLALIHAALDGELSAEEQRCFGELIARSAAARRYYYVCRQYQKLLQGQRTVTVPADLPDRFSGLLLNEVSVTSVAPHTTNPTHLSAPLIVRLEKRSLRHKHRTLAWLSVACSLFIAVLVALLSGFQLEVGPWLHNNNHPHTVTQSENPLAAAPPLGDTQPHQHVVQATTIPDRPQPAVHHPPTHQQPHSSEMPAPVLALAPLPRPAPLDVFTAPPVPPVHINLAEIKLPFLRSLSEFDREEIQQAFLSCFQGETAVRIDLFTRDLHRGVQWLQKATGQMGLHLFVDSVTADRLKKNQPIVAVLLYCDSLTPTELSRLFFLLHTEDARISPRLFDGVHVMPVSPADERELREVLGMDLGLNVKTRHDKLERGPSSQIPQRPLSEQTAEELAKSFLTKNKTDKTALLTAWGPPAARVSPYHSVEIRTFLTRRSARTPQAVPALIILRLPLS
jgi:hypothetical protein